MLSIRGTAEVTEIQGVVREYAQAAVRDLGKAQGEGYVGSLPADIRMGRIAVRPDQVVVVDLPLDLGQRHPPARRLRQHPRVHGRAQHLAEELVGLLDRRRRQPSGTQVGHPGPHVVLADRGQRRVSEPG